jgi:lysozyme family protein
MTCPVVWTGRFEPDGGIGAATLAAVEKMDDKRIIEAMAAAREKFYRGLSTFDTFGKGWLRRNQETLEVALTMVGKKTVIGKIASSLGF